MRYLLGLRSFELLALSSNKFTLKCVKKVSVQDLSLVDELNLHQKLKSSPTCSTDTDNGKKHSK